MIERGLGGGLEWAIVHLHLLIRDVDKNISKIVLKQLACQLKRPRTQIARITRAHIVHRGGFYS